MMQEISNKKLTLLRKLSQKKYRQKERLFLVEGDRAVQQVISNKQIKIDHLFFDEARHYWEQKLWGTALQNIPSSTIAEDNYAEVSDTDNPQGVLALCPIPAEADVQQLAQKEGLMIATDAMQDPGNLGTIIRTASWFGVKGLLSGKGTVDLFHPKVVRSTAGATGSVPFANVELYDVLSIFEQAGWETILLDAATDAVPLQQISKKKKMVLVIGNEAHGIDPKLYKESRNKVKIVSSSQTQNVESLNAAIAASIALYALS